MTRQIDELSVKWRGHTSEDRWQRVRQSGLRDALVGAATGLTVSPTAALVLAASLLGYHQTHSVRGALLMLALTAGAAVAWRRRRRRSRSIIVNRNARR